MNAASTTVVPPLPAHPLRRLVAQPWGWARQTFEMWNANLAPMLAAGLAYFAVFSIVPLLVVVISLASIFLGAEAAHGEVFGQLASLMGTDAAQAIGQWMADAQRDGSSIRGALVATVASLIGATTLFSNLQTSLDQLWREPGRPAAPRRSMLRGRMTGVLLVFALALLVGVSLIAGSVMASVSSLLANAFGVPPFALKLLDVALGFVLAMLLFTVVFRVLPQPDLPWNQLLLGAAVTATLITIGRFVIALYLGRAELGSTYGAAGSFVVVLAWLYYSALVFLFGAQATWVLELRRRALCAARGLGRDAAANCRSLSHDNSRKDDPRWPSR